LHWEHFMKTFFSKYSINILIGLGFITWLVSAWFSEGFYQADEHFQIIEFANYKLGNIQASQLPWEFAAQMRPGFQPWLAYLLIKSSSFLGISSPFAQATVMRIIIAILAFVVVYFFFKKLTIEFSSFKKQLFLVFLFFFLWFMPPLVVRFSSENLSGLMMVISVFLLFDNNAKQKNWIYFVSGLTAGIAFLFRYQSAIMISGLFLWLMVIKKPGWTKLLLFFAAFIIPVCLGFLFDHWLYNEWVVAPWNYFRSNILDDKISGFGIKPWHHYFTSGSEQLMIPVGIIIWLSAAIYWITKWRSAITWISLPFVLFHIMIGHKEVRFLFPMLYFIPLFILQAAYFLKTKPVFKIKWIQKIIIISFVLFNVILGAYVLKSPLDEYVAAVHKIYKKDSRPVVLFYKDIDPQCPHNFKPYFYNVSGIQSLRLDSAETQLERPLSPDTAYYFFDESHGIIDREPSKFIIIIESHPRWISVLNFGNWLQRTRFWCLYEIQQ
jgi:phosphatidylinositol glycan class B